MAQGRQKWDDWSVKTLPIIWTLLTGYLIFHTWHWDPTTPFLTTELLVPWLIFAIASGIVNAGSGWDSSYIGYEVSSNLQRIGYLVAFTLYSLIVVAFNAGVFVGMLFALDAAMRYLDPNAGVELVTIHPSIGPEANRYLLLLFFIVVTIAQSFSIGKPLAQWFNTNMASWLKLTDPSTSPKKPDQSPSQQLDKENSAIPEPRFFRTVIRPGGRVEVASPELQSGWTVDVVVRPTKRRSRRKG